MDVICTFVAVPSLPASPVVEPSPLAVELALAAQDMAERSLPSYMLPQYASLLERCRRLLIVRFFSMYIPLNRIPITASNKIDRKTLSAIYANLDLKAWEKALGAARGFVFDEVDEAEESKWNEVETKLRTAIIELTDASPDAVRKGTQLKALGVDSVYASHFAPLVDWMLMRHDLDPRDPALLAVSIVRLELDCRGHPAEQLNPGPPQDVRELLWPCADTEGGA